MELPEHQPRRGRAVGSGLGVGEPWGRWPGCDGVHGPVVSACCVTFAGMAAALGASFAMEAMPLVPLTPLVPTLPWTLGGFCAGIHGPVVSA